MFAAGGSTDSRQLAQLQMLYDARGHRLEEMTAELKRVTEDGDREIRILHHKLGLKQGHYLLFMIHV